MDKKGMKSDTLYIRAGGSTLVFARYDRLKEGTLNYSVYRNRTGVSANANMHGALQKVTLAHGDFGRVSVLVEGPVTLVPLNEFDEDDANDIYAFNYPAAEGQRRSVLFDTLPGLNAVMLFSVDKDMEHTLTEEYGAVSFHSTQMPPVLHFASCCRHLPASGMLFACTEGNLLTVVAFRNGELSLLNSYEASSTEDRLYYILAAAKRWGVKEDTDEVNLAGGRDEMEALQHALKVYLPNVSLLKPEEEFNRHVLALAKDLPYDLITLLLRAY